MTLIKVVWKEYKRELIVAWLFEIFGAAAYVGLARIDEILSVTLGFIIGTVVVFGVFAIIEGKA